jgi:uncharacterized protein YegP (UPF0339 family)
VIPRKLRAAALDALAVAGPAPGAQLDTLVALGWLPTVEHVDDEPHARPGFIRVTRSPNNGEWYVSVQGGNGGKVLTSEGYDSKANAIRGARAAKRVAAAAPIIVEP